MCFKPKRQRQIAMGWVRKEPIPAYFPEGYTVEKYNGDPNQKKEFFRLWTGKYGTQKEVDEMFYREFEHYKDCKPTNDVHFVKYGDEYIGTITAIRHPARNMGYVHMVAIREDFRGKHLSRPLNYIAMKKIYDEGCERAYLTTGSQRKNAIRSYLKAGFLPLQNAVWREEKKEMIKRWKAVYKDLDLGELVMLDKRFKPMSKKKLCVEKKQRQLAMGWIRKEPTPAYFPEGYSVVTYNGDPRQKKEFYRLWRGEYGTQKEVDDLFRSSFEHYKDCVPEKDVHFVLYGDEYIGTITAIHHPKGNWGYVHMVAIREDFRGKHLSRPLNYIAMKKIWDDGCDHAFLTTDDWRKNAIRSYIKAGFYPFQNGQGKKEQKEMVERWRVLYDELELGKLEMVDKKYNFIPEEELNK